MKTLPGSIETSTAEYTNRTNQVGWRLFLFTVAIGAVFPFIGLLMPNSIVQSNWIISSTRLLGYLIPCIDVVAKQSMDPERMRLVWSFGWLPAPVYLAIMVISIPPWAEDVRADFKKRLDSQGRRPIFFFFVIIFMACFVLSDFNLIDFVSIYRGNVFSRGIQGHGLLGIPFYSPVGSALYAWLVPLCEAVMYYIFFLFLTNSRTIFFRSKL